ncbi:hypothetical protein YTPLAS18_09050 [Nitrospira sp.]|nr:hypothetical protein YTPLAS18_09050 [Nitrospira sp.]
METVYKPDSVPPGLLTRARVIISLGGALPRRSSDLPEDLGRASLVAFEARSSPYLILLRATLAVPEMSPPPRWALTPPFHPCLSSHTQAIGGLFSVALVSDRSAWALPSTLPWESGLSSSRLVPTGNHPTISPAQALS